MSRLPELNMFCKYCNGSGFIDSKICIICGGCGITIDKVKKNLSIVGANYISQIIVEQCKSLHLNTLIIDPNKDKLNIISKIDNTSICIMYKLARSNINLIVNDSKILIDLTNNNETQELTYQFSKILLIPYIQISIDYNTKTSFILWNNTRHMYKKECTNSKNKNIPFMSLIASTVSALIEDEFLDKNKVSFYIKDKTIVPII